MTVSQLLKKISPRRIQGPVDAEMTGLFYDSRQVRPGGAFFALRGQATDGHRFIDDALARGAGCVFLEEERSLPAGVAGIVVRDCRRAMALAAAAYFGDPTAAMPVVGVTGTNGKTTVTYLVESILHAAGRKPAVLGTINYRCGRRILPAPHTTPESVDLLGTVDLFRREGADSLVAEVSSHALDQQRVAGVQFDVGIFTNLTPEHLDFHGSMENYFSSKEALFSCRKGGEDIRAVVNVDDPYGARLAARLPAALTCATEGEALIRPRRFTLSLSGVEATVDTPRGPLELRSPLLGKFNLQNLLCAVGAGIALDVPLETVARGLADAPLVPGRLERIENGRGALVLVDYAHTGDALEKVLTTLGELSPRRILALFGCGGDRDRRKRPVMGEVGIAAFRPGDPDLGQPSNRRPPGHSRRDPAGALRVHSREWSREEAAGFAGKGIRRHSGQARGHAFRRFRPGPRGPAARCRQGT